MDGRWWRRLAAFSSVGLLAAIFADAAIERVYAQTTPKPTQTTSKPTEPQLTDEERRQGAY
jgi:hypothetical protein